MGAPRRQAENYRRYAEDVLAHYMELTSVTSTNSCSAFYQRLASGGAGSSAGGWFKPIPSDFVADVEVLARKFLSHSEYISFRYIYMECMGNVNEIPVPYRRGFCDKLDVILLKLGRVFEEQGLWPVSAYFRPQDLRGPRSL